MIGQWLDVFVNSIKSVVVENLLIVNLNCLLWIVCIKCDHSGIEYILYCVVLLQLGEGKIFSFIAQKCSKNQYYFFCK